MPIHTLNEKQALAGFEPGWKRGWNERSMETKKKKKWMSEEKLRKMGWLSETRPWESERVSEREREREWEEESRREGKKEEQKERVRDTENERETKSESERESESETESERERVREREKNNKRKKEKEILWERERERVIERKIESEWVRGRGREKSKYFSSRNFKNSSNKILKVASYFFHVTHIPVLNVSHPFMSDIEESGGRTGKKKCQDAKNPSSFHIPFFRITLILIRTV